MSRAGHPRGFCPHGIDIDSACADCLKVTGQSRMKAGSNPAPSSTGFKRAGRAASTPRAFTDAPNAVRCKADIKLRDGSLAQCGRREAREHLGLCWQHSKGCDCQAPNAPGGVQQVSMTCPIHNERVS